MVKSFSWLSQQREVLLRRWGFFLLDCFEFSTNNNVLQARGWLLPLISSLVPLADGPTLKVSTLRLLGSRWTTGDVLSSTTNILPRKRTSNASATSPSVLCWLTKPRKKVSFFFLSSTILSKFLRYRRCRLHQNWTRTRQLQRHPLRRLYTPWNCLGRQDGTRPEERRRVLQCWEIQFSRPTLVPRPTWTRKGSSKSWHGQDLGRAYYWTECWWDDRRGCVGDWVWRECGGCGEDDTCSCVFFFPPFLLMLCFLTFFVSFLAHTQRGAQGGLHGCLL